MALHLTRIDEFALITLDRPEVLNTLNFELLRDLGAAFDQVAGGDARALLVTGRRRQGVLRGGRHQGADGPLIVGAA
jgi:enoyl-CoA hydratase/carnithine racemase